MKVRNKKTGATGHEMGYNMHALSEIIVGFDDEGGQSSEFTSDYEVFLEQKNEWKDLHKAMKDRDVIHDNYNTRFFEPTNEEDRKRGYTLT